MQKVAFLVSDLIQNHPSCISGEAYYRPTGCFPDRLSAESWAGSASIVTVHAADEARRFYDARRLPLANASAIAAE